MRRRSAVTGLEAACASTSIDGKGQKVDADDANGEPRSAGGSTIVDGEGEEVGTHREADQVMEILSYFLLHIHFWPCIGDG